METINQTPTRFPRRPPRLPRVFQDVEPFYFITFNTHQRQSLLANQPLHNTFLAFCSEAHKRSIAVGRYCIMPDHIHLFVKLPPEGITLPKWLQALKAILGKELLRQGQQKPHWQEGFFDHLFRTGNSYSEKWEYVRQNPVRKNLVSKSDDWPYQGEIVTIMW
ncbi:MAG: transposase [bacterium]